MAHSPDRPDREFSASQTYEDMAENLFAAPPLGLDKLFDDPIVRRRIGEIICLVMSRPPRLMVFGSTRSPVLDGLLMCD